MAVVSAGFVIILGYLQEAPLLYGGYIIPVALPTAIALELIGLGILAACGPDTPPVRIFVGPNVINRLMRAFVPATIVLTLIDGFLYHEAFITSANPALATSLIALISVIVVGAIIFKIAKSVGNDIDCAHAERDRIEEAREQLIGELRQTLAEVRTLSGLLPICASCKNIRDDHGYWTQVESYIRTHTSADFTHCLCPECAKKLYPEYYKGR